MPKYYSPAEDKLKTDLEPVIARMDYDAASKLKDFFDALDSVTYRMKNLVEDEMERIFRYKIREIVAMTDGLSEEDSKTLSDFLTQTINDIDQIGSRMMDLVNCKDAHDDLASAADERYYSPRIPIRGLRDNMPFDFSGEEARDFIKEYGQEVKEIHLKKDGRVSVTLPDGVTFNYAAGDPLAEFIRDYCGQDIVSRIAATD